MVQLRVWCRALAVAAGVLLVGQGLLQAQTLPSYVIVERIGGDSNYGGSVTAASSVATAVFLDTFNPNTALQTLPGFSYSMPTVALGANQASTDSGSATSNGYLTRLADGTGYAITGYNATVGTAGVAGSNPATINRVMGTLTGTISYTGGGSINTSTGFNDGVSNNFRSIASVDGTAFWGSTAGGIRYQNTPGSVTSTIATTAVNTRNVRIFNNTLFYAASSGTAANNGIFVAGTVGVLPTTASVTTTQLPGLGTSGTGTPSAYSFYLFNNPLNANDYSGTGLNTLYIADDRTSTSGGIQRWMYDGINWTLTGTFNYTGNSNLNGARGLTATIDTSGASPVVNLWATGIGATGAIQNDLFFVTDTLTGVGGAFDAGLTLATSPTNTFFRGVEIAAVPEPSTYALMGVTGLVTAGTWYYRRQREAKSRFARVA